MGSRIYRSSMWAFDAGAHGRYLSLEEGLTFVLDRVEAFQQVFAAYKGEHDLVWWCGHFQSAFNGGPELSVTLLDRLAKFGARLFIDTYFSPATDQSANED